MPLRLQAWFAEHKERLRSRGITSDLQRSPDDDRDKTSAWMALETDARFAVLIVWSSGEAELEYGDVATDLVRQQHRDLRTFPDLLDAIETIYEWIHPKSE
ncbi:immunity protein TriTu family protein [Streptomyces sp. NPDC054866]